MRWGTLVVNGLKSLTHFTSMFRFSTPRKRRNQKLYRMTFVSYGVQKWNIGLKQVNESTSLMSLSYLKIENKDSRQLLLSAVAVFVVSLEQLQSIPQVSLLFTLKILFRLLGQNFQVRLRFHVSFFPQRFTVSLFPVVFCLYTRGLKKIRSQFFLLESSGLKLSNKGLLINSSSTFTRRIYMLRPSLWVIQHLICPQFNRQCYLIDYCIQIMHI